MTARLPESGGYSISNVAPFWPAWILTLDAMIRNLAPARLRCRRCAVLLWVNPAGLRRGLGSRTYDLVSPRIGCAHHVLVDDAALLEGVIDPVGVPFRSRWRDLVLIAGRRCLAGPVTAKLCGLAIWDQRQSPSNRRPAVRV